ncbi:MAG TPA: hypothetical protein VEK57_22795 [Thermoanaerobaculia bacterium]|nr:hypothetical protein [Thermoanaerobaculia bacterium]
MPLTVEEIKFNHDTAAATVDAFNIRLDENKLIEPPEWKRGVSVCAPDSRAAYSIRTIGKNVITIQARFKLTGVALPATREIRAMRVDTVVPDAKPLGNVAPTFVKFDAAGDSGWITFKLTAGTGSYVRMKDIKWEWQSRPDANSLWKPFTTTAHRIYIVLTIPTAPWVQTPFDIGNLQLPWATALDYACCWAYSSSNVTEASGLITEHVYALGPSIVTYDCPGGGASHYSFPDFDLTAFLDRLAGGPGNGVYVNCSDCATITSSFANLVGANLWQSRMGWGFDLNVMLGIGSTVWETCCGWGGFSYHEVAWIGSCLESNPIWDACLQVDANINTGPPRLPVLPKNQVFSDYRKLLVPLAGQAACAAQPATRTRRPIV